MAIHRCIQPVQSKPIHSVNRVRQIFRGITLTFLLSPLIAVLASSGVACDVVCHPEPHCEFLYGHRSCEQWPADGELCASDGCEVTTGCVDACSTLSQSKCGAVTHCKWDTVISFCVAGNDACSAIPNATCGQTEACARGPTCTGQGFDCAAVPDTATCQNHPHCYWEPDTHRCDLG